MTSLSTTPSPFPPPTTNRRPVSSRPHALARNDPEPRPTSPSSSSSSIVGGEKPIRTTTTMVVMDERTRRIAKEMERQKAREEKERKEMMNRKIASQKAVSVILRREATKAIIDTRRKKRPTNPKKLLPRTVLEALHERITSLRWESALKGYNGDNNDSREYLTN